jgi:hypothetical protein
MFGSFILKQKVDCFPFFNFIFVADFYYRIDSSLLWWFLLFY